MDVKLLSCRLVLPLVSCVLTTCVMPASVSHASGMGGTESTSDGGGVITAHASYEFTTVGSGGGDGGWRQWSDILFDGNNLDSANLLLQAGQDWC